MNITQKVREFLTNEKIDYLLVNATNEFLVEYSDLSENSRYFLTNFTGSTGDALLSTKNLFLFVDGRYHEQADNEVDHSKVDVVKLKLGESFSSALVKKIKAKSTLAIVSKKISQGFLEVIENGLKEKNVKIKLLDFDPVFEYSQKTAIKKAEKIEFIPTQIAGMSPDEKLAVISESISLDEALLTTNLEEVSYLCNLRNFAKNYSSKIEAKCVITKGKAIVFANQNLPEISKQFKIEKLDNFENAIKDLKSIKKIIIDKHTINAFDYNIVEKKALTLDKNILKEMKSVKTTEEIEHYKKCFEKTDKALSATRKFIFENENLSELDIAKKLEEEFYNNGAKSLSFKSIVAIDENSALAHYSKSSPDKILKDGGLVLIDCGAYYEGGYATDITRVFIKGKANKLQKRVYTAVLKGNLAAYNKRITPKTNGMKLDETARKLLYIEAPQGFSFSHSLGHGIGINVHEAPPVLAPSNIAKTELRANMCFTIEPGLYKKGSFGVRLENSCYLADVNDKLKIKSFTKMYFEKELIDFELLSEKEKKWLSEFELR